MICSMTAFAREESQDEAAAIVWELRSVNNRYLDVTVRLPEDLRVLEPQVRERVSARLSRGKVECILRYKPGMQMATALSINLGFASQVAKAARQAETLLQRPAAVSPLDILRWPGVVEAAPLDAETLARPMLELLEEALDDLVDMRCREGEKIAEILRNRCADVARIVEEVRGTLPTILAAARERMEARLTELRERLDSERVEQEMVLLAQKMDVAEELDRIEAHLGEVHRVLGEEKPVGRRLDFLMQELNREANTVGSKSVASATSSACVDLKVFIEQMREQIQNIE